MIYLYWWHELISTVLDKFFMRKNKEVHMESPASHFKDRLFLLIIYFVFIVVIFCFISNWNNRNILFMNLRVLMFQDWLFNLTIVGFLINEWWLRYYNFKLETKSDSPFTGRMMVLHVSIILGGFIYFLVLRNFPEIFTPENLWGSLAIISPFLILKTVIDWKRGQTVVEDPEKQ